MVLELPAHIFTIKAFLVQQEKKDNILQHEQLLKNRKKIVKKNSD